jgi:hypothetical protein
MRYFYLVHDILGARKSLRIEIGGRVIASIHSIADRDFLGNLQSYSHIPIRYRGVGKQACSVSCREEFFSETEHILVRCGESRRRAGRRFEHEAASQPFAMPGRRLRSLSRGVRYESEELSTR